MATVLNHASAPPRRPGPYKVDISRGSRIGRVSSEWFSRPDDERYLSLGELHAAVEARARRASTRTVETRDVRVEASREDPERLALMIPGRDAPVAPTHWSFGHPIEAGRLPNGDPDLYFRGFYCWNSEVGSKTLGMASFYLRAVCMNRNIWGAEGFEEISIRHSKFAANRFAHEAGPALENFANSSPAPFMSGIAAARQRVVARTDEDRQDFLRKRGFSKADTRQIIATVLDEEGHPPASIFDFVQGITAIARDKPHQDARLDLEGKAAKLSGTRRAAWPCQPTGRLERESTDDLGDQHMLLRKFIRRSHGERAGAMIFTGHIGWHREPIPYADTPSAQEHVAIARG